jgi:Ca2+-binding RTX toxin-like protein
MAMRKTVLVLAVMASALVVASGVAWAATIECPNRSGNLCVGTKNNDTMTGTASADDMKGRKGKDRMSALGGNDTISGGPGTDVVRGGLGNDTISGDNGRDRLFGNEGSDRINTAGEFSDEVDCGPDTDSAVVDSSDRVVNCEQVVER